MQKIKKYVDRIKEELDGAKEYAEDFLANKKVNPSWSKMYYDMARDELKHAEFLHEMVQDEIKVLSESFTPPQEMVDKWERAHKMYVETHAWIEQMLLM